MNLKKLLASIVSLSMLSTMLLPTVASAEVEIETGEPYTVTNSESISYISGDVNRDGRLNVLDTIEIRRRLLHLKEYDKTYDKYTCDVNCNGKVNMADVVELKKHLLHLIELDTTEKTAVASVSGPVSSGWLTLRDFTYNTNNGNISTVDEALINIDLTEDGLDINRNLDKSIMYTSAYQHKIKNDKDSVEYISSEHLTAEGKATTLTLNLNEDSSVDYLDINSDRKVVASNTIEDTVIDDLTEDFNFSIFAQDKELEVKGTLPCLVYDDVYLWDDARTGFGIQDGVAGISDNTNSLLGAIGGQSTFIDKDGNIHTLNINWISDYTTFTIDDISIPRGEYVTINDIQYTVIGNNLIEKIDDSRNIIVPPYHNSGLSNIDSYIFLTEDCGDTIKIYGSSNLGDSYKVEYTKVEDLEENSELLVIQKLCTVRTPVTKLISMDTDNYYFSEYSSLKELMPNIDYTFNCSLRPNKNNLSKYWDSGISSILGMSEYYTDDMRFNQINLDYTEVCKDGSYDALFTLKTGDTTTGLVNVLTKKEFYIDNETPDVQDQVMVKRVFDETGKDTFISASSMSISTELLDMDSVESYAGFNYHVKDKLATFFNYDYVDRHEHLPSQFTVNLDTQSKVLTTSILNEPAERFNYGTLMVLTGIDMYNEQLAYTEEYDDYTYQYDNKGYLLDFDKIRTISEEFINKE